MGSHLRLTYSRLCPRNVGRVKDKERSGVRGTGRELTAEGEGKGKGKGNYVIRNFITCILQKILLG